MSFKIHEANSTALLKKFVTFQYTLYAGNRFWVPSLKSDELNSLKKDKNPAFEFCDAIYFIAVKDGKIAGRIAGIINRKFNDKFGTKEARFGWFDVIDDEHIAHALLQKVQDWAITEGMVSLHGPLGFTDMDAEGLLIDGFEELSTLGAYYNFPYYQKFIEDFGFVKDADWVEFLIDLPEEIPEKISRLANIVEKRYHLRVLEIKKAKEILPRAKEIFYVLNAAYKDLYGFVELSEKQIDLYIKQYFGFVVPEYVPMVVDSDDKLAAFGIAMPSVSKALQKAKGRLFPLGFYHLLKAIKKNDSADLYLTAVRPDMQDKGLNAIIIHEINKAFLHNGVKYVETNRELDDNEKIKAQWRYYPSRQHKRRRSYVKNLNKE